MEYKIVVIRATGRVGREVFGALAEFQDEGKISIDSVIVFASKNQRKTRSVSAMKN